MATTDRTQREDETNQLIFGARLLASGFSPEDAIIVRRVEQTQLFGTHAERSISLDCALPDWEGLIPVPVACIPKDRTMPLIEATDGAGRALSLLSARDSERAAHLALAIAADDDRVWNSDEHRALCAIVSERPEIARSATAELAKAYPEWFSSKRLAALSLLLSDNWLIWVLVESRSPREIVKVRWTEPLEGGGRRAVGSALTGQPASVMVELASVPSPGPYHAEARVPEGLEITQASFGATSTPSSLPAQSYGSRAHGYSPASDAFAPSFLTLRVGPAPQFSAAASVGAGVTALALAVASAVPSVATDRVVVPVLVTVLAMLASSLVVARRSALGLFGALLRAPLAVTAVMPLAACLYLLADDGAPDPVVLAVIAATAALWMTTVVRPLLGGQSSDREIP